MEPMDPRGKKYFINVMVVDDPDGTVTECPPQFSGETMEIGALLTLLFGAPPPEGPA